MERVFNLVESNYSLFATKKGNVNVLEQFKKCKNGVLFATDSMGEGIDLAGDILSSVVIVTLPFPVPTALSNYERDQEERYEDFREKVVIPSMLTKLRQWIGRGIRTETDTCVFSILDCRASKKYARIIEETFYYFPITDKLDDVKKFIIEKKEGSYFE